MLSLLLSLCCGLANACRGSGIKHMKFPVLIALGLSAYTITGNWIIAILFPLPLGISWWIPGGTGLYMPWVVEKLSFLGLKDLTWRFFEFASVFLYCLICGTIYNFIN